MEFKVLGKILVLVEHYSLTVLNSDSSHTNVFWGITCISLGLIIFKWIISWAGNYHFSEATLGLYLCLEGQFLAKMLIQSKKPLQTRRGLQDVCCPLLAYIM